MPWSTRQLADLAGTTVNTVRHYHHLGLLAEPERLSNGYKQYTVQHLVRLLRIRRLADLGVPLTRIEDLGEGPGDEQRAEPGTGLSGEPREAGPDAAGGTTAATLRALDGELAAKIAQLEEARTQIAGLLAGSAPADTPPGFESVSAGMSPADRSLLQIYSQLYRPEALEDVRAMVEQSSAASARFDALPPDADEETREQLAQDLLPALLEHLDAFPWLLDPAPQYQKDHATTRRALGEALREIYNEAQRDVIARIDQRAQARLVADQEER
jgi:DNA-binding transcriptional MerR regulator